MFGTESTFRRNVLDNGLGRSCLRKRPHTRREESAVPRPAPAELAANPRESNRSMGIGTNLISNRQGARAQLAHRHQQRIFDMMETETDRERMNASHIAGNEKKDKSDRVTYQAPILDP